jgi:ribosome-associated protein
LACAKTAEQSRAKDVVVLDLREITPVFDYFVIATGTSSRQLLAIADEISQMLKRDFSDRKLGMEGVEHSQWVLLDYGDVVVHLFDADTREYYRLEDLWDGAKHVPLPAATS